MKSRRFKKVFVPVIYGVCVVAFLFGMYFAQDFVQKKLFSKKADLEYVDGEITDDLEKDIPVVGTTSIIVRPYLDSSVTIARSFYDYNGDSGDQEKAIIYYEDTYMQNSGVDYASENTFDVISVLDGTVISVEDSDILGKTVQIRHSNDLITVYQSLSDVTVKVDDQVIQGQIIAKSGTSNIDKELGNHLHFELFFKGEIVNPEEYYNKSIDEL